MPKKRGDSLLAAVKRLWDLDHSLFQGSVLPSHFARKHGVNVKTFHRDLKVLEELGRPAMSFADVAGGKAVSVWRTRGRSR
jgi:hypothetical protein